VLNSEKRRGSNILVKWHDAPVLGAALAGMTPQDEAPNNLQRGSRFIGVASQQDATAPLTKALRYLIWRPSSGRHAKGLFYQIFSLKVHFVLKIR
jgi:hypothetical protein